MRYIGSNSNVELMGLLKQDIAQSVASRIHEFDPSLAPYFRGD